VFAQENEISLPPPGAACEMSGALRERITDDARTLFPAAAAAKAAGPLWRRRDYYPACLDK